MVTGITMTDPQSSSPRLATSVHVTALLRIAQQQGDFAVVLNKGDPTSGTILIVMLRRGDKPLIYQRFYNAEGLMKWDMLFSETPPGEFDTGDYLKKRLRQDPDLWIIELDTADEQRLIRLMDIVA